MAAACLAILGAVKLVTRAVRRAVDDGNDKVTSDAERRAETLGAVLTNAARVLEVKGIEVLGPSGFIIRTLTKTAPGGPFSGCPHGRGWIR